MYSPALGRFISPDPTGFSAGDPNFYRPEFGNPVSYTDPSGLSPVGHHWIPVSVLTDPAIRAMLSNAAFETAMGAYSGETLPSHNFGTYGGVSHAKYNDIVKKELDSYLRTNKVTKMTQEQMWDFMSKVESGLDHKGKLNKDLKAFNDGIRAQRQTYLNGGRGRGFKNPQTATQCQKQGQSYLKSPRFMLGAILAGLLSGAISEAQGAMSIASGSAHFRNAMKALSEGDLAGAERHFFGPGDAKYSYSFYQELVDNKLEKAAAVFEEYYLQAVRDAQTRVNKK